MNNLVFEYNSKNYWKETRLFYFAKKMIYLSVFEEKRKNVRQALHEYGVREKIIALS